MPRCEALGVGLGAEEFAPPHTVLRVLHLGGSPHRGCARGAGGIRDDEIARQQRQRPAVRRDVVNDARKDVLARGQREDPSAQRRLLAHIEPGLEETRYRFLGVPGRDLHGG